MTERKYPVAKSRAMFMTWLKQNFPNVYEQSLTRVGFHADASSSANESTANDNLSGLGAIDWSSIADSVTKVGTAVLGLKTQQDLIQMNMQRAQQGLPPLTATESGAAPTVQTQVSLSPELQKALASNTAKGIGVGTVALLGLGAFVLLRRR